MRKQFAWFLLLGSLLSATLVFGSVQSVKAAFGIYPSIVEDTSAVLGQEYVLTLVNEQGHKVTANLELGMATMDANGRLDLQWSEHAKATAAAIIHLADSSVTIPANGTGSVIFSLQAFPDTNDVFPIVAAAFTEVGLRARLIVPLLLQPQTSTPDLFLESVEWQQKGVVVTVGNLGCGFAKAEAAVRVLGGDGDWQHWADVQGYIFPDQSRQWLLPLPSSRLAAELSTSLTVDTWLSSSDVP